MHRKNKLTLKDIADKLKLTLNGDSDFLVDDISVPKSASETDIILFSNKRYLDEVSNSKSLTVVTDKKLYEKIKDIKKNILIAENIDLVLPALLSLFEWRGSYDKNKYRGTNFISDSAEISESAVIMENVVIRDNAVIGDNSVILPNTYIGENSVIGDNTVIKSNVSIYEGIKIGNNVIIHSGVIIGTDGFGYNKNAEKKNIKIPQIGGVVIEDNVEIGANSTIDRGTIGDTIIKSGTKIDNLVQIAHNDVIGENVIIAGQAGVSGSSIIEDNVIIAGQVGIADHAVVEEGVIVGAKTGVTSRVVKKEEKMVFGIPARPLMQAKKSEIYLSKLPEIVKEFEKLKKDFEELKKGGNKDGRS